MAVLKSEYLEKMGDILKEAGTEVMTMVDNSIDTLSASQKKELRDKAAELFSKSKKFYALAGISLKNEFKTSLDSLVNAKLEMIESIKKIQNVQKVIDIVSQLVVIAGCILSQNYGGVVGPVKSIVEVVSK